MPESGRSQWVLADEALASGRTGDATDAYARALSRLGGEIPFLTRSAGRLHQAGVVGPARALALRAWAADSVHASAPQLPQQLGHRGLRQALAFRELTEGHLLSRVRQLHHQPHGLVFGLGNPQHVVLPPSGFGRHLRQISDDLGPIIKNNT